MGRHLGLFEWDVLSDNWVVLLQLQFALHRALVLPRVVRKASTSGRNEANVVAHSERRVPRRCAHGKDWQRRPANGFRILVVGLFWQLKGEQLADLELNFLGRCCLGRGPNSKHN